MNTNNEAKPQVVAHLKRLLADAEVGKITSFAAVTFGPNGRIGYSGEFTEAPDKTQAVQRIGELQERVRELHASTN